MKPENALKLLEIISEHIGIGDDGTAIIAHYFERADVVNFVFKPKLITIFVDKYSVGVFGDGDVFLRGEEWGVNRHARRELFNEILKFVYHENGNLE